MFLIIFNVIRVIIFIVFQKLETEIKFIYPEQDFFTFVIKSINLSINRGIMKSSIWAIILNSRLD